MTELKAYLNRSNLTIFLLWLFHLSAIIGVSMGYDEWFISKTPLNLILIFSLMVWALGISDIRSWVGIWIFFTTGMFVEWLGVNHGLIFGEYTYGEALGPKFQGVPWLIGINWATLTVATGIMAKKWVSGTWFAAAIGAGLMVFLDLFIEVVAPVFDFWNFHTGTLGGTAPLQNYIGWFVIAFILQVIHPYFIRSNNTKVSGQVYMVQLVFFSYFAIRLILID